MRCRTCDRPAWHWHWFDPARTARIHMTVPTCSRVCMDIWKERRRMVDPNRHEVAAMEAASDRAGEYIEALGKTDMAQWTELEWTHFIETVCGGYVDALVEQQAAMNAAVAKVRTVP